VTVTITPPGGAVIALAATPLSLVTTGDSIVPAAAANVTLTPGTGANNASRTVAETTAVPPASPTPDVVESESFAGTPAAAGDEASGVGAEGECGEHAERVSSATRTTGMLRIYRSPFLFGVFAGRPPRLPFARAAAAFRSLVTLPPFRPMATAAGFFRAML
jgi:hypothetical protein